VAIPGKLTTAYLALRLYQPDCRVDVVPFDQIEDAVQRGDVDAGLLIHEGQLTYGDSGLHLWADLGAWWMEETGLPLPLGGNAVRRDLGPELIAQISRDLRASIVYGLEHRAPALAHAKQYNRGIGDERTDTFVGMYVNQWTVDYGPRGRLAVQTLLDRAHSAGVIPERVAVEFVG
jgi:1,4-dihydroxy-6-naphthoate synthase